MRIVETIAIEASAAQVWAVLSDTERYTDWNPFTQRVKGKLEVGEIVRLKVRLGGRDVRTKHRVSAVVDNERICWKVLGAPGWLLGGERCQVIETVEVAEDDAQAVERLSASFELSPDADAHYVFMARGSEGMSPVYPGRIAWAMTAAIRVDLDADGWDPPLPALIIE